MILREYQQSCLDLSLSRYQAGVNRQLAVLATGLGKAVLFAGLRSHHGFRKRVMVLVHREELAIQAGDKIHRWNPGLMIGTEMAQRSAGPMCTHVVASVPTLGRQGSRRLAKFDPDDFDCIVSDEAHHSTSPQWRRVLKHFGLMAAGESPILSLGLTATPNRADGTGLRLCFDEIVYDMGIDAGIRQGYLVDLRCWRISTKTNLDAIHERAGKLDHAETAKTVNTPERNGIVVRGWAKHAWRKKTLVFTEDVQHALDLAEAFKAFGVVAEAVYGEDPERAAKLARHRSGETEVLCNARLLTEGHDDREIECIVLTWPSKSSLLVQQMIGRGTRLPSEANHISEVGEYGKQTCIILEIGDITSRHQLCTVPSLLGLPKDLDLRGETYRKAKDQIERVAKDFPTANFADLKDLNKLDHIAQQVSLFAVKYPPEIGQLTELAWQKQGDGYVLPITKERLTLAKDLRDEWWVRGSLDGQQIEIHAQNLAGAFNAADREVLSDGKRKSLLSRGAHWRELGPSEKQVALCRRLGLEIPMNATRGMVSAALDAQMRRSA